MVYLIFFQHMPFISYCTCISFNSFTCSLFLMEVNILHLILKTITKTSFRKICFWSLFLKHNCFVFITNTKLIFSFTFRYINSRIFVKLSFHASLQKSVFSFKLHIKSDTISEKVLHLLMFVGTN